MACALVTDSNAQLDAAVASRWNARVLPVTVVIDGTEYLEGVTLDADGFWALFQAGNAPVVLTSQPSPGRFVDEYQACADAGYDEVVSVHVAAGLSGTLNSARIAAELVDIQVHLVDSQTASFGVACCVREASRALEDGSSAAAAAVRAKGVAGRLHSVTALGAARLLEASGRAHGFEPAPDGVDLFTTDPSGGFEQIGAAHDSDEVCDRLAEVMHANGDPIRVALGIADRSAEPYWQGLEQRLAERTDVVDIVRYRIGPSVGAFTGPGTAGGFWYRDL